MVRSMVIAVLVSLAVGHTALAADPPNLLGAWKAEKASVYSSGAKGYVDKADITVVVNSQHGSEFEGSLRYVTTKRFEAMMNICGTISADGKRVFAVSKRYVGQGDINPDGSLDLYLLKFATNIKAANLHLVRAKQGVAPARKPTSTPAVDLGD